MMRQLAPVLMIIPGTGLSESDVSPPPPLQSEVQAERGQAGGGGFDGPDVTIRSDDEEHIQEYRVNDRLFMIKVTPEKGIPYFLVDTDGDGRMDSRRNELEPDFMVPQWTLLRWK